MTLKEKAKELIKKYESSMAVPMYPKALVIDFMEKAYEAGMKADVHTDSSNVIAELEAQIEKMKRCIICKHYSSISGCSYHSNWVKDCKENGMKLFELKEIKKMTKLEALAKDCIESLIANIGF